MITTTFKFGEFEAELTEVKLLTEKEMLENDLFLPIRAIYTVLKGDEFRKAGETFSNGHSEEEARNLAKDLTETFDMVGEYTAEEIEEATANTDIEAIVNFINESL